MYDVSVTDPSYIVADAFRFSHLVFASSTYNNGLFSKMETLLADLKGHNLQNRTVVLMENGTWSPMSGKVMREFCDSMKNMNYLTDTLTMRSALAEDQVEELNTLANTLAKDILK